MSSSMMRQNSRSSSSSIEASCTDLVRRMVSLPRSILGGVSRAMEQGMDLIAGRRNHPHPHNSLPMPNPAFHHPLLNSDPYQNFRQPSMIQEEWVFLSSFEQQFGAEHPFFYACRFVDALKMAQNEHKLIFLYLHSPEHPFTPSFCRETLGAEVVVQFLDANFICWGAIASRGEGVHLASTLRAYTFPFCAVVAPAAGDNLAVLQQIEGPVSPAELVEILQRTMEEQGVAFGSARAKEEEEKRRADRRLREEQDVAYISALQIDQEKERQKESVLKLKSPAPTKQESSKVKMSPKAQDIKILIRFPNGERREQSFLSTDKVQAIFGYVNSLGFPGIGGNFRLISNFPRKVYSDDQMGITLADAGFHPKASLFLELL